MISDWAAVLAPSVMERVTLLLNHVLSREPAAMQRLAPHAGALCQVAFSRWPALLPQPPGACFCITPAGLLEWQPAVPDAPGLRIEVDGSNPAALALGLLRGQAPAAQVSGDTRLAGDIDWVIAHVRWDIWDDLQTQVGPAVAQGLEQAGWMVREALTRARQQAGDWAQRFGQHSP
jgi:ubiquinone biosynthesis protein UbiJ